MALPASGPISSSQVATEFSVSQTNISLSNLGTQLSTPITAGQPVNLATSFYGQSSGVSVTAWTFASNNQETWESVEDFCENLPSFGPTLYHDGSGTYPSTNDVIYSDDPGTTTVPGGIYGYQAGRTKTPLTVDNNGKVTSVGEC
jgi:hypothetical protein